MNLERITEKIYYFFIGLVGIFVGVVLLKMGLHDYIKLSGPIQSINENGSSAIVFGEAIEGELDWCIGPYYSGKHLTRGRKSTHYYDYILSTKDGYFIPIEVYDSANDMIEGLADKRLKELYEMMSDEKFDISKEMAHYNDTETIGRHVTGIVNPLPTDRDPKLKDYINRVNEDAGKIIIDSTKVIPYMICVQSKEKSASYVVIALIGFLASGGLLYIGFKK